MARIIDHELRIGQPYDYYEFGSKIGLPCILIDIHHDGYNVIYTFKHESFKGTGSTIYPMKLLPREINNGL